MVTSGGQTLAALRVEQMGALQVELSAVFRERHDFKPGSTIHLQPDLQRAHLFDAQSGERLAA